MSLCCWGREYTADVFVLCVCMGCVYIVDVFVLLGGGILLMSLCCGGWVYC